MFIQNTARADMSSLYFSGLEVLSVNFRNTHKIQKSENLQKFQQDKNGLVIHWQTSDEPEYWQKSDTQTKLTTNKQTDKQTDWQTKHLLI